MMTVKEVADLYHREYKAVEIGEETANQRLSDGEVEQNRKTALQRMNDFSKEQLINYILFGDKHEYDVARPVV